MSSDCSSVYYALSTIYCQLCTVISALFSVLSAVCTTVLNTCSQVLANKQDLPGALCKAEVEQVNWQNWNLEIEISNIFGNVWNYMYF